MSVASIPPSAAVCRTSARPFVTIRGRDGGDTCGETSPVSSPEARWLLAACVRWMFGVDKVCRIEAKAEETQLKQLSPASGQRRHFSGYPGDIIDYGRRPGGRLGHDSPGMCSGHFHTTGGWVFLQRAVRQNGVRKRDRARCKQGVQCVCVTGVNSTVIFHFLRPPAATPRVPLGTLVTT